jgi:hypothetical protein
MSRAGVAVLLVTVITACGGDGATPREKANAQICKAGKSMVENPESSPILRLANPQASPAIQLAGQAVVRAITPGEVDLDVEPLRGALAELRRACGDRWR